MKQILPVLVWLCCALTLHAQLNRMHNAMRCGDEIIKQQVEYKDPGRQGENVLWDFSRLKSINPEYTISYACPEALYDSIYVLGRDTIEKKDIKEGELIVGLEHSTMYYYRIKNDTLLTLGHENPLTLLMHKEPLLCLSYPFSYGQSIQKPFTSKGLYSSKEEIQTEGDIRISCDAYGKLLLPSGDTLRHVLRIKSVQDIFKTDSLEEAIPLHLQLETYRWYVKGYRYPVFETVKSFIVEEEEKKENFTTAFFYPPQEHYYLSDDRENLAVLDSLWQDENKNITDPNRPGDMIWAENFAYNFYPNPVESILNIEYMLEEEAEVSIFLFDTTGKLIQNIPGQQRAMGLYEEQLNCSMLSQGNYILRIRVNQEIINQKIIKR